MRMTIAFRCLISFLMVAPMSALAQTPPTSPTPNAQPVPRSRPPVRNGLGNAASGFVINPVLDDTPPEIPSDLKPGGVLIFSKTVGYRDEPAIQASDAALGAIAHEHGWPYFITENGAIMNSQQLSRFKLVIWSNTSGDLLNDAQKAAFKQWVEDGGSFVGIHGAGGDPVGNSGHSSLADWRWYVETLIGAQFKIHSTIMPADIHIEDPHSRLTRGLPAVWHRTEEWYAFDASPRQQQGFHILAGVDEKSYTPGRASMGEDHPLVWWHCVGRGRAFYSALGHAGSMYSEPSMIQLLDNAMSWGLSQAGRPCAGR